VEIDPHEQDNSGQSNAASVRAEGIVAAGPSPRPAQVLSLDVPCDSAAPAVVRAALGQIEGLGSALGDVLLVASELVTNAVVHSGGSAADVLTVTATLRRAHLLISVHDPGLSGQSAQTRPRDDSQPHGLGLRIVEQLASEWGAEDGRGYRVWAELALPA
jgi:anti-sigma regulatory factor (Ser/Thr protein kinase)